jgi:hypothetical protein
VNAAAGGHPRQIARDDILDAGVPPVAGVADQPDAGVSTPVPVEGKPATPKTEKTAEKAMEGTATKPADVPPAAPTSAATPAVPAAVAASATQCPWPTAFKPVAAVCPLPAVTAGVAPPKEETAPALPVMTGADFDGDKTVTSYADSLAACRADRTVQQEVETRFQKAVKQAGVSADEQAKIDRAAAIQAAADAAKTANTDPKKLKAEVDKAKQQAGKQADADAKTKRATAVAAVTRQDMVAVKAELKKDALKGLSDDFKATIAEALAEQGPGWRAIALASLKRSRTQKENELKAKPKVKKGETPPPAKTPDEVNAELESFMQQKRCEQAAWVQTKYEQLKYGWMVGRREKLDFDTIAQNVRPIPKDFKAPRDTPEADLLPIPDDLGGNDKMPGVAPEVVGFLRELQALYPTFNVGNYAGHGSWEFVAKNPGGKGSHSMGFSVDLTLTGKAAAQDERGFYQHAEAVDFLLKLDQAAQKAKAEWRALYNDFGVAEEVNRRLNMGRVGYIGNLDKAGRLNWHGPHPLKLHFHLDIAPTVTLSPDKR